MNKIVVKYGDVYDPKELSLKSDQSVEELKESALDLVPDQHNVISITNPENE